MSDEAREFLSSIKERVGVIGVAGKYWTGKSFLLNRVILNKLDEGFGVGPTINPCTKGIFLTFRFVGVEPSFRNWAWRRKVEVIGHRFWRNWRLWWRLKPWYQNILVCLASFVLFHLQFDGNNWRKCNPKLVTDHKSIKAVIDQEWSDWRMRPWGDSKILSSLPMGRQRLRA